MASQNEARRSCGLITRRQLLGTGAGIAAVGVAAPLGLSAAPGPSGRSLQHALRQDTAPVSGGNLVAAGTGDIKFDPYFNFVPARFVYTQFYSMLFDYRGEDGLIPNPQLVESYLEEEKTLTVTLRPGVKFHNGREMVAQDIVDNIARAKDESIGHYLFAAFDASVESAEVIDTYTAKINYKTVYPVKLDNLSVLFLIPKEAMADIGSGRVPRSV